MGGLVTGSLALLADAAHMLTDVGCRPAIRRAPRTKGRIAEITLVHLLRNSIMLPPLESGRESQTVNGVNVLGPLLAVPVTSGPLLGMRSMRLTGALIASSVLGGAPLTAVRRRCMAGMSSSSEGAGLLIETPSLVVF